MTTLSTSMVAPPEDSAPSQEMSALRWHEVCSLGDLVLDRGVCALVEGTQVALFRVAPDGDLYALANHDPFSKANVLSRGIVGSRGDRVKVASPVFKQSFDLATGVCLDDESVRVPTFAVRVVDGRVEVGLGALSTPVSPTVSGIVSSP